MSGVYEAMGMKGAKHWKRLSQEEDDPDTSQHGKTGKKAGRKKRSGHTLNA